MKSISSPSYTVSLTFMLIFLSLGSSFAELSTSFYSSSCPSLSSTVKPVIKSAISREKRMGASVLRLFFHDCFVNGCDGSLLLDDTSSFTGEKTALPNVDSARGFEVIDDIKSAVEEECPDVVSCADILAMAARDSVSILGGPKWDVKLGRRDATTASKSAANSDIPPPTSSLSSLISIFKSKGLSTTDLVALSGAHTIGKAQCKNFRDHIYNDTNIDATFALDKQGSCSDVEGEDNDNLSDLDRRTAAIFDNKYFKNLVEKKGLLHSDQELYNGGSTDSTVTTYSKSSSQFSSDFVDAMIKMGDISPLTGSSGEIRKNCRVVNS